MAASAASVLNRLIQNATRPRKPFKPTNKSPTASILPHLDSGDLRHAVAALATAASPFPSSVYARLLQLCSSRRALVEARRVESHLVAFSPSPSTFLLNRAIETLANCGSLSDARELFDEMPQRDGGSWNAIIAACFRADQPEEALSLFSRMNRSGIRPKDVTLASVLGCCADLLTLFLAKQIHGLILKLGFCLNVILGTSLVDVYGKCWVIDDARRMFDSIPNPNAVSWNVIVRRYLELGRGKEAVIMFFRMIKFSIKPLSFTISNALMACSDISSLKEGRQVHGMVVKIGFEGDNVVGNSLMEMYAKCDVLEDARRLFDQSNSKDVVSWTSMVSGYATCGRIDEAEALFEDMPERNVVSWNAMLAGYVRSFHWDKAMDFFNRMRRENEETNYVTLGLVLNACAGLLDPDRGKQIHGFAYRHGFCSNLFFSNALLHMYAKNGCLRSAEIWFLNMACQRDRISWNCLISGYACHGRSEEAMGAFSEMQWETAPNEFTFGTILAACANIFMLEHGKQIHGYMIRNGFEMDVIIRGALVDMYSKCRLIEYGIKVFEMDGSRDIVLWNSMVLGCAYNGRGEYSLELFEAMRKDGIRADNVTFIGVLLACISEGYVNLGRRYFDLMTEEYGVIPRVEHYECMIELLGKHGFMVELEDFIEHMPFEPTIPMWTRIFDCCREHANRKLGERAARCINESNPLNPVQFEVLSPESSECT
ncbi:pentatricopeptide repeat-containing protein [Cocos nucifera]|uniref:Pentatricopeptide repeat-containing protein n=1 Tax=Cocos nucifera TaxID=13894 RepID=A0A8K0HZQ2_COCNU|nr:pentatricopeptide repeat-containing protein [Cocos nucifera]